MSTKGNDDGLPDKARLAELVEEAVVDCYDEEEQLTGLFTMIEENLALPFATRVLGVEVTVESIDLTDDDKIVAGCRRGRERQAISLLELPLPSPPPDGAEWIHAYRYWAHGQ
ncbi:MAG: calcium-binding protein [Rhodospirillales bacterium]|nr:calcium-binding protein [Rhodospirillales bacterium]